MLDRRLERRFVAWTVGWALTGLLACGDDDGETTDRSMDGGRAGAGAEIDGGREPVRDGGRAPDARVIPPDEDGDVPDPPSTWPAAELLAVSDEDLERAPCRIEYDEYDDGRVDRRWGYEYDADGRLVRELRALVRGGGYVERSVHVFDDQGRLWASCADRTCSSYAYRDGVSSWSDSAEACGPLPSDGSEVEVAIHADPPTGGQLSRDLWLLRLDGTVDRVRRETVDPEAEENHFYCYDGEGALMHARSSDPYEIVRYSYHRPGVLAEYSYDNDPDTESVSCDETGWQRTYQFCPDGPREPLDCEKHWSIQYQPGTGAQPASSITTVDWSGSAEDGLFTTEYAWSADGRAARMTTVLPSGTLTDLLVVDPPPPVLEHDADGNVTAVRIDADADGEHETTHRYRYAGEGACRAGTNPQLTRHALLDAATPKGSCAFEPVTRAFERLLETQNDTQPPPCCATGSGSCVALHLDLHESPGTGWLEDTLGAVCDTGVGPEPIRNTFENRLRVVLCATPVSGDELTAFDLDAADCAQGTATLPKIEYRPYGTSTAFQAVSGTVRIASVKPLRLSFIGVRFEPDAAAAGPDLEPRTLDGTVQWLQ